MNRKPARIIAALAFVALVRPFANAFAFAREIVMRWMLGIYESPCDRLLFCLYKAFGMWAVNLAKIAFLLIFPAVAAGLIYRYLLRRDVRQVCDDCAAHKVWAWTLFALFVLFSFTSVSFMLVPAPAEEEPIPLDEAMEQSGPVSLEFCLCHPDSDELVRNLCGNGKPIKKVLAEAPAVEGYRLMPLMDGTRVSEACYVSKTVELSEEDVASASVHKSYMDDGRYDVRGKLSEAGGQKMYALTSDYKPRGAKNPNGYGRRLAIIVNGKLVFAPYIQTAIGAEFCITGKFSRDEAVALAVALNSRQRQDSSNSASTNIVSAARRQIGVTVGYDPAYRKIGYPGGDVPRESGVCTDVIIRALRDARKIDLQKLVHEDLKSNFSKYPQQWGLKKPDPNIDHRRVPNLQCYFKRKGYALPVSMNAADYKPGDIVTVMVGGKLPHIMIVSDMKSASGGPLVLHNIGSGTQEEDVLFAYPMTGHYRIP